MFPETQSALNFLPAHQGRLPGGAWLCDEQRLYFLRLANRIESWALRDLRRYGAGTKILSVQRKPEQKVASRAHLSDKGPAPISAAQFAADTNSYTLTRQRENVAGVRVDLRALYRL